MGEKIASGRETYDLGMGGNKTRLREGGEKGKEDVNVGGKEGR